MFKKLALVALLALAGVEAVKRPIDNFDRDEPGPFPDGPWQETMGVVQAAVTEACAVDGSVTGLDLADSTPAGQVPTGWVYRDDVIVGLDQQALFVNVSSSSSTGQAALGFYAGPEGAYSLVLDWSAQELRLENNADWACDTPVWKGATVPVSVSDNTWYALSVEFFSTDAATEEDASEENKHPLSTLVVGALWTEDNNGNRYWVSSVSASINAFAFGSGVALRGVGVTKCFDQLIYDLGSVVRGDPHFYGYGGERYEVSGESGRMYSLVSDHDLQVNARYTEGCRGAKSSVIDAVGITYHYHKIMFSEEGLLVDGAHLTEVGRKVQLGATSAEYIELLSDGSVEVVTKSYGMQFNLAKTRCHTMRIDMGMRFRDESRRPHGLLGQTLHSDKEARDVSPKAHWQHHGEGVIQGHFSEYEVSDIFSSDFKFKPE